MKDFPTNIPENFLSEYQNSLLCFFFCQGKVMLWKMFREIREGILKMLVEIFRIKFYFKIMYILLSVFSIKFSVYSFLHILTFYFSLYFQVSTICYLSCLGFFIFVIIIAVSGPIENILLAANSSWIDNFRPLMREYSSREWVWVLGIPDRTKGVPGRPQKGGYPGAPLEGISWAFQSFGAG